MEVMLNIPKMCKKFNLKSDTVKAKNAEITN